MKLNITDITVFRNEGLGSTIGYANIVIADAFTVKNIRIVNGRKGVFLGMPNKKLGIKNYVDVFFPINQDAREELTKMVFDKFKTMYPEDGEDLNIYLPDKVGIGQ